jgi:hypothetical protein
VVAYRQVVRGARGVERALRGIEKDVGKDLREGLRSAGQVVQREAAQLFAPVSPRSAAGYKVRVRRRGVAVEQSLRPTTGEHPEFGALQMRTALLPALERHEPDVVRQIEAIVDKVIARHGLR